jgi:ketosteroid isomerase-like protein
VRYLSIIEKGGNMKKSSLQFIMAFSLAVLLFFAFACQKKAEKAETKEVAPVVNLEAEKAAVKTVLDQFIQASKIEDMELFSKIMAHDDDMVNLGTDAAERWVGWEPFKNSIEKQFASLEETDISVREQVIKVHKSGEVAWFSEFMDLKGKAQGQPYALEGARFTGVLEKRNGSWLIVQIHGSVPVSGQAVKY